MQDAHIITAPDDESSKTDSKKKSNRNAILIVIGAIVLFVLIGGGSFIVGRQTQETPELSPTPSAPSSQSPTPTTTIIPTPLTSPGSPSPSPSPTPTPQIKSVTLSPLAPQDGFRSSNNGGNAALDIRAGRNVNLVTRGFASFDLSDIPAGSTIEDATLRLYQTKTVGNPYGVGGNLKIDHLTYGDTLDSADYGSPALSSSFATLTNNSTVEWKDADVTDALKDDVANARAKSQYRIHFSLENTGGDVTGDFAYFEAAENTSATGNTPQLIVKYY